MIRVEAVLDRPAPFSVRSGRTLVTYKFDVGGHRYAANFARNEEDAADADYDTWDFTFGLLRPRSLDVDTTLEPSNLGTPLPVLATVRAVFDDFVGRRHPEFSWIGFSAVGAKRVAVYERLVAYWHRKHGIVADRLDGDGTYVDWYLRRKPAAGAATTAAERVGYHVAAAASDAEDAELAVKRSVADALRAQIARAKGAAKAKLKRHLDKVRDEIADSESELNRRILAAAFRVLKFAAKQAATVVVRIGRVAVRLPRALADALRRPLHANGFARAWSAAFDRVRRMGVQSADWLDRHRDLAYAVLELALTIVVDVTVSRTAATVAAVALSLVFAAADAHFKARAAAKKRNEVVAVDVYAPTGVDPGPVATELARALKYVTVEQLREIGRREFARHGVSCDDGVVTLADGRKMPFHEWVNTARGRGAAAP